MNKIIEFKNITFQHNEKKGFKDFNLDIKEGDIITLIGPSGAGKTTLLNILCNRFHADGVYYKGIPINECNPGTLIREIVVIFDSPITSLTVSGELKRYIRKIGTDELTIEDRIFELNKYFNIEALLNKELKDLNQTEKLLIKIIRYLIIFPRVLAIDNLLGELPKEIRKSFFSFIKKHKITLINATTDLDDSLYGNKIMVLENFILILEGSTLSVLKTDTLLKRLGFRLPLAVDLSIELNHYEVIKKIYTTEETLVGALWK